MKRVLLIFVVIFLLSFVSPAVFLEVLNKDLQAGETFVGKIETELISGINQEDVKIFEGRRQVQFEKGVFSYENLTFIYVIFPIAGNFSINLSSFFYYSNGTLMEGYINHPVEIKSPGNKVLSIVPGIVTGSTLSFFLINTGSEKLNVKIQGNKTELEKDASKKVEIRPEKDFFYLNVDSYRSFYIPVIYFNSSSENDKPIIVNQTNETEKENLSFELSQSKIERNFINNQSYKVSISIKNRLDKNISLSVKSDLRKISFNENFELNASEEKVFTFDFFSENTGVFSGNLSFSFNGSEKDIWLLFYVLENEEDFEEFFQENAETNLTCSNVGGKLCYLNEECVGGSVRFVGGYCCVGGQCKSQTELYPPSKKNYLVGIISIAIAGVFGYFVYKRFKNVKAKPKF